MRAGRVVAGFFLLVFAVAFFAVPSGYICGAPLLIVGLIVLVVGLVTTRPVPVAPPPPVVYVQQPAYYPPPPQPQPVTQVYQKEVVTREVVKVRCRYCGALVDEGVNTCPKCQAPMR